MVRILLVCLFFSFAFAQRPGKRITDSDENDIKNAPVSGKTVSLSHFFFTIIGEKIVERSKREIIDSFFENARKYNELEEQNIKKKLLIIYKNDK